MKYEVRVSYYQFIGEFASAVHVMKKYLTDTVKDADTFSKAIVEICTEESNDGRIKVSIYETENDQIVCRRFYTYEDYEMISFNKDKGEKAE